jgi:deazaflavin-dependent oxidoreductase (nitroreductase family)
MSTPNHGIIEEFRANEGRVGGMFEGRPLLLLHHRGARSGTHRVSPLMYQRVDNGYAVFASKGGARHNPAWYHNLMAFPETSVEVGARMIEMKARVVEGDERGRIWERQKREWPQFAEYDARTSREIPVIILELA